MNIYFEECIKMAKKSYKHGEVPVGAIIVKNGKIVAKSGNKKEKKYDILGHAEIIAIKKASKKLKTWKLNDCEMYVTLKPCVLCENVIKISRISKVYYLLDKDIRKKDYNKTIFEKSDYVSNYSQILNSFFVNKRRNIK